MTDIINLTNLGCSVFSFFYLYPKVLGFSLQLNPKLSLLGNGRRPVVDPSGGFEEGEQGHSNDSHRLSIPYEDPDHGSLFPQPEHEEGRKTKRALR